MFCCKPGTFRVSQVSRLCGQCLIHKYGVLRAVWKTRSTDAALFFMCHQLKGIRSPFLFPGLFGLFLSYAL